MLINQSSDDKENKENGEGDVRSSYEYETANELFEIMASNSQFDGSDETLTTSDLVILYKNLDVGTRLMSEAKYSQIKASNQYVETVVYEHDSDESDIGEIYSTEDIRNIMMVNKERIDLFNNTTSFANNLSAKLGNIAMNPSNILRSAYDKNLTFKDPYIKEQLSSFIPLMTDADVIPSSLLDYICCKRLEDNGNIYMDNIIRYVQHTIEQLKRISNGDYLTDKAKEKWRQSNHVFPDDNSNNTMLANSVSIPLHVERKSSGIKSTWHDVVHSEVDVRSLSRILQKKIVIEIPRLICGTYKLFSKCYNDNLIISCKKEVNSLKETSSRVDVVLKLKTSESGLLISKLNSIKILQTVPQKSFEDSFLINAPALTCKVADNLNSDLNDMPKIVEVNEGETSERTYEQSLLTNLSPDTCDDSFIGVDTDISTVSFAFCKNHDYTDSLTYPSITKVKSFSDEQTEANLSITSPNALRYNLRRLNMNSPVPEETEVIKKKRSPTRIRIKSPYENSSHAVEEKKRKKLLEIRERREMKRKSLSDKLTKYKYTKGVVMAQASSSVTRLSISNKSFYNSIYGQVINNEAKFLKKERKPHNQDLKIVVELENCEDEVRKKLPRSPKHKEKYINHSYYLDDADTEVMHLENKLKSRQNMEDACTASSSEVSDDLRSSLKLLKDIISIDNASHQVTPVPLDSEQSNRIQNDVSHKCSPQSLCLPENVSVVPSNSPKDILKTSEKNKEKDSELSVQCRKSIDKIYDLMKKLGKTGSNNDNISEYDNLEVKVECKQIGSSIQPSDSGTSLKHHLFSSNPSCFSFEKPYLGSAVKKNISRKREVPIATLSKIKSPTKSQSLSDDKEKKDSKKISSPVAKTSQNPLKAISQLLRDFENVQNGPKTENESKAKRSENDKKNNCRQVTFRKPIQHEPTLKPSEPSSRGSTPKHKKSRVNNITHVGRSQYHIKPSMEEKSIDKLNRRKITDIIDEVKEARGEAVRGPPKSRLDSLARPRKYSQQPPEQLSNRNRNPVQRPNRSINNMTPLDRRDSSNAKMRQRKVPETSGPQKPHSAVAPLGIRQPECTSPDRIRKRSPVLATGPSYKTIVPAAPETLLKKMVAVETYVNNHYGHDSPTREFKGFAGAQKSRVPLIPMDLDIESMTSSPTAEESTTLGKKLHNMIDTMISSTTAAGLASLCEKKETSVSSDSINDAFVDTIEHYEELLSNTDFPIDVFGDKSIATAVASLPKDNETILSNSVDFNVITYDIQPFNSLTELARLENALYRRLSSGTFQKRLRIKNLTLTPKHSLQQILVLQSGDVGSLVVKSTLSQNVLTKSHSNVKEIIQNKNLAEAKSHVDWIFANIPTQVSTVAYSVPHTSDMISVQTDCKNINKTDDSSEKNYKSDKKFTRKNTVQGLERGTQADLIMTHQPKERKSSDEKYISCKCKNNRNQEEIVEDNFAIEEEIQRESKKTTRLNIVQNTSSSTKQDIKSPIVDDSTSLDILVGLLNEIKNITTCQTHLTDNKDDAVYDELNKLEVILKTAKFEDLSVEQSSINALSTNSLQNDQLQNMQYFYKTNYCIINDNFFKEDKEVDANFPEIAYTHTLTDVQSKFFPITVHHSTNVTNSLVGVINEPSQQSMYYFSDYNTLYCNTSFNNKITELPTHEKKKSCNFSTPVRGTKKIIKGFVNKKNETKPDFYHANIFNQKIYFDPIMKIKRDLLVTVYSVLVMTVFAALSFPEIFYRM